MADKFDVHTGLPIDLLFEWKNYEHLVNHALDLFDTAFAPCPDLGTDVVNHRCTRILDSLRKTKIEIGKIDQNCRRWSAIFDPLRQPAEDAVEDAERTVHFKGADNCRPADVARELNAGFMHPLAAKTVNLTIGI